jgi:hypothetical protein
MYFQSNNKKKTTNNLTEKLNFILENNFNKYEMRNAIFHFPSHFFYINDYDF